MELGREGSRRRGPQSPRATMALNRGFSAPIVQALGGGKTERMMRRYAAVTDQTLRAAETVSGNEPTIK